MIEPSWAWILANFAFPVVFAAIILYMYRRKDQDSIPRQVYEDLQAINLELRDRIILTTKTLEELLDTQAITAQTTAASKESLNNLCHMIDLLILMGGGKIDRRQNGK